MPTITGQNVSTDLIGWRVQTNVWNPETLTYGTDYTISATYTTGNLASHPTFNWAFPRLTQTNYYHVHAYPELMFGGSPWWGGAMSSDPLQVFPIKVNDLANLTIKYDLAITGDTQGYNVAFEIFLTSIPNGTNTSMTNEIMVWFHKGAFSPGGSATSTYSDSDFTGSIYTATNWTAGTNSTPWTYTAIVSDADDLSGKIDFTAMLAKLKSLGTITGNEYIAGLEFGAEVATGVGSLAINSLEYDVQVGAVTTVLGGNTGGTGADRIAGSNLDDTLSGLGGDDKLYGFAGNDTLSGGAGSNTIDGGNGTDTLALAGAPGDYFVSGSVVYGAGQTDTLTSVEQVSFGGQTLTLSQFQAQAMTSLKVLSYIASYADLIGAFGDNTTAGASHYFSNGLPEGREITFDPLAYLCSYSDLMGAFGDNQTFAVEHYIKNGFAEGRQVSFDALAYIASYDDLTRAFGDNVAAGEEHYIKNGYGEGRKVSFSGLNYIASYGDLIAAFGANAGAGVEHYLRNGFAEHRAVTFDPVAYLISNSDLGHAGFTADNAVLHYIANGYAEQRSSGTFGSEQTAHTLAIGGNVSDTIDAAGDKDWFAVTLTQGQTYTFRIEGANGTGTLASPFLSIYDAHGLLQTYTNDTPIPFMALSSGTFYLVASASDSGTGSYKLFGATGG
jgi:hypothetical protein